MSKFTFPTATLSATWFRQSYLDQLADIEFLFSKLAGVYLTVPLKSFRWCCSGFRSDV